MATQQYGGIISNDTLEAMRKQGITDDAIADQMAKASPSFASQVMKIRKAYGADPAATTAFLNTRFYGKTDYTPEQQKSKGYVGRTLDRIYNAGLGLREDIDAYNQGETTYGQAVTRGASQIFRGILSPATEAISTGVGYGLEKTGLGNKLAEVGQEIAQSDVGQTVAPYVKGAIEKYQQLPEGSGFRDIVDVGAAGLAAADVYGVGALGSLGKKALTKTAGATARTILHPISTIKGVRGLSSEGLAIAGKAEEAVRKGVDERLVRFIGERNPDEKYLMKAMMAEAEKSARVLGGSTKHKELVGQQILRNAEHVIDTRQNVGKALGNIVKAMENEMVDLTDEGMNILTTLKNRGVSFNGKNQITSIAGAADDEIPVLQKIVDFFTPDSTGRVSRTFKDADLYRKKIFAETNAAKAKLAPSSGGQSVFSISDAIGNQARSTVLQKMSALNKNYGKLAQAYSELISEPSDFFKALGYKGPLDEVASQSLRAGEVSMRVLGNAAARPMEALQKLIQVARKYGYESTIDELGLIRFADELENIFPISPTRSIRGEFSRGAGDVVERGIERGTTRAAIDTATGKAVELYRWARGMTPENRLRLLNELLDASPEETFAAVAERALPNKELDDIKQAVSEGLNAKQAVKPVTRAVENQAPTPSTMGESRPTKLTGLQLEEGPKELPVTEPRAVAVVQDITSARDVIRANALEHADEAIRRAGRIARQKLQPLIDAWDDLQREIGSNIPDDYARGIQYARDIQNLERQKAFMFADKSPAALDADSMTQLLRDAEQHHSGKPIARRIRDVLREYVDTPVDNDGTGFSSGFADGMNGESTANKTFLRKLDQIINTGFEHADTPLDEEGNTLVSLMRDYATALDIRQEKAYVTRKARMGTASGRSPEGVDTGVGAGGKEVILPDVVKNNMGIFNEYVKKGMSTEDAIDATQKYVADLPF